MWGRGILLVSFALIALGFATKCPKKKTSPAREILCYTSAFDVQLLADSVCSCTTLVHQNHDVQNLSISEIADLRKSLREMHPPLQFVISIHDAAKILRTSAMLRQEIIARIIAVMNEVDGVELNVTAGSKERLYNFIKSLKDEMIRKSYDKRIFVILPTKSEDLAKQFDLKELTKYVDLFTLPTDYLTDEDGAFVTFHPSRLMGLFDMLNTDSLIDLISGLGAPKRKILVSLPANAYRFTLKDDMENAPRSPTVEKEPISIGRKQFCEAMNSGEWTVERDEDLTAPYAFQNKTWISFEDKISVGIKGKYALLRDLAGLAVQNIENDTKTECEKPLTQEIYHSFTEFKRKSREAVLNALEDELHQAQFSYPNQAKTSNFRVVRVVDTEGHIRAVRENMQTEFVCKRQGYFVHPKSCNRFYRCVKFNQAVENYSVFEFDCPAGLSFDERTEVCVWPGSLPQGSPCPGSSEIAPVAPKRFECPPQSGYYADPQNCRWFFACIDLGEPQLRAFEFRCPYGLVFDEKRLVCEWPWLVPACSESGSAYTRTEYDYRGYSADSTIGVGGYVTGGLLESSAGVGYSGDYSKTTGIHETNRINYIGSTAGNIGGQISTFGIGTISGYAGLSDSAGGNSESTGEYGGSASSASTYSGSSGIRAGSVSPGTIIAGGGSAGYLVPSSGVSSIGHAVPTGLVGSSYSESIGGYGESSTSTYSESSGIRAGSVSPGTIIAGGSNIGYLAPGSGISSAGHAISTGSVGGSYSESTRGYGGSSTSTYSGSSGIRAGSVSPGTIVAGGGSLEYLAPGSGISSAGHTVSTGSVGSSYSESTRGYGGSSTSTYSGSSGIRAGSVSPGTIVAGGGNIEYLAPGSGISSVGHAVSTGSVGGSYSESTRGYGGSSTSTYSGSSGIRAGSVSPGTIVAGGGSLEYLAPGSGISSAGHAVFTSSVGGGYSESTGGYEGSSTSTYSGSSDIRAGSLSPGTIVAGESSAGYLVPSNGIGSAGHAVSTASVGGGYSGYNNGINTATGLSGISANVFSKIEGYPATGGGSNLTGVDVSYSEIPGSSYSASTVEEHTGGIRGSSIGEGISYSKTPGTNYPGATRLPGSSTDVRVSSIGSKHVGSTGLYTGSSTFNTGDYTAPTNVYAGSTGHQPSSSVTGPLFGIISGSSYPEATASIEITSSINKGYSGSTAQIYQGSTSGEYSKATSGISAGSGIDLSISSGIDSSLSSSGRMPGSDFINGASKSEIAISGVSGHAATTVDTNHFVSGMQFSGATGVSSTGIKYDKQDGYTIPVFIQPEQPIYPSIETTGAGVRDHTGTTRTYGISVTGSYGKTDLTRPNFNISVIDNKSPVSYDQTSTGAILTGSNVEGNIITGDSLSGTVLSHGNIPGAISTAAIDQGAILTGGTQSGYVATSSGTPGYVISGGVKTVDIGSASPGIVIYGTPTPAVSLNGPSTSGVLLKSDVTPGVVISGQTAPGVSIGGSIQPGTIVGLTGKPYVSQSTYHGISDNSAATRGSVSYSSSTLSGGLRPTVPPSYKTDEGHGTVTFNVGYDTSKYSESDIPDYRPTSATLPDSIVSDGRIESTGGVILGSTLIGAQGSSSIAPGYPYKSPVFTPSGFTKTGPTRTGITTAILGGGGSYSISTSERRPILKPENIGEKAFEENIEYTKTPSINNIGLSSTLIPPGYSSTIAPSSQATPQSVTSGYSYPKPTIQFETSGAISTSEPISPTEGNLPVTTPMPFLNVEVHNGSPHSTSVFGSKVPTVPVDHYLPTPMVTPIISTTEQPDTYRTILTKAAKIPVSTVKPIIDTNYKTVAVPTNIPVSVLTDDRFSQHVDGSRTSTSMSNFGVGVSFQQTDSSGQKDYSSFISSTPILDLPGKSSKPGITISTARYDVPTITVQPELIGVTYKKPLPGSDITYNSPSISPTTYKPPNVYDQGFSTASSVGISPSDGSPTNLGISRDKIDKLITNYDRGTIKYTPSIYDIVEGSGYSSTSAKKFSSSSLFTKSSSVVETGGSFAVTTPCSPTTSSYEVTTKSIEGKGKVIVKWSDLHPLLLGKLGAECTCRADPFATLRGPGKKNLIASSKGKVDLANYDDSEIYVDLENDRSSEENDYYVTNYRDPSPQPYKISPHKTTSDAVSRNLPASSYLPVSSTISTKDFVPSIDIHTEVSAKNDILGRSSEFQVGLRTGKKLKDIGPSPNSIPSDQEDDPDQIIDGATDCARPGLFRHPNLCNKFYACYWDQWKKKFTLHIFNCPVHLTFDSNAGACNWPSKGPACQADNLLI